MENLARLPFARNPALRMSNWLVGAVAAAAVAMIPAAAVWAQGDADPFTVAETGQSFGRLQDAVNAIGNGSDTIAIAPGTYRDCAVQEGGSIVIGTITHIHAEERVMLGTDKINLTALQPIGRLMGASYCRVEQVIELDRPKNILGGLA